MEACVYGIGLPCRGGGGGQQPPLGRRSEAGTVEEGGGGAVRVLALLVVLGVRVVVQTWLSWEWGREG